MAIKNLEFYKNRLELKETENQHLKKSLNAHIGLLDEYRLQLTLKQQLIDRLQLVVKSMLSFNRRKSLLKKCA